jgi:hypothetical protein
MSPELFKIDIQYPWTFDETYRNRNTPSSTSEWFQNQSSAIGWWSCIIATARWSFLTTTAQDTNISLIYSTDIIYLCFNHFKKCLSQKREHWRIGDFEVKRNR